MRRKTLDLLLNYVGALLTVMLLVAGTGCLVGYTFTNSQVKSQLIQQKVFFPTQGQRDYQDLVAAHQTALAGKQVLTGSQAEIFADDIIKVDTKVIAGGKTYAELSAANPTSSQTELVFRGDTLQGLLLNAYAFGFVGQIAFYAALASYALALIMLILTLLGIRHYRQGDPSDVI